MRGLSTFRAQAECCLAEAGEAGVCWGPLNRDGGISEGVEGCIVYVRKVESVLLDCARVEVGDPTDGGLGS